MQLSVSFVQYYADDVTTEGGGRQRESGEEEEAEATASYSALHRNCVP